MAETPRGEIEITSAMIDAAALELAGFNTDYAPLEEWARDIVEAALKAGGFIITEAER